MAGLEQRNHARSYLKKSQEYLASAEDNLDLHRYTVAAGDAIHAGNHPSGGYAGDSSGPPKASGATVTAPEKLRRGSRHRAQSTGSTH